MPGMTMPSPEWITLVRGPAKAIISATSPTAATLPSLTANASATGRATSIV